MPAALYLLALAVFAMGTSEFMLAGLLPDVAPDLGVSVGTAGLLTSAFAIGMLLGAPLVAATARRWAPRRSLTAFLVVFLLGHLVGAATTSFAVLLATRVIAALANAGFLAVALSATGALVPPDAKGRALAVLLSGTTAATVAGVPGGALIGATLGWRAAFVTVALLCVPALLGVLQAVPTALPRSRTAPGLRHELAHLRERQLVVLLVLAALVNAGTFAAFTFLAPLVEGAAGLSSSWVPVALVLFGLGSSVGVALAGRLSDHRPGLVVAIGGPLLLAGWILLDRVAAHPAPVLALALVQGGLAFAVGSTLITRVLYAAAAAPTMAGAYATAALNAGAVAGPALGGAALAADGRGPSVVSALLVGGALLLAALSRLPRVTASGGAPPDRLDAPSSTS